MRCLICDKEVNKKYALYCDDGCRVGLGVRKAYKKIICEKEPY